MTWDVTVTDTLAESYIEATSSTAGAAAESAADGKELKYQSMQRALLFLFSLVDVSQLVLAICEKLLFYFNACH